MSRRVVEQHADWLGLLEPDGAFLTAPVLAEAFPTGLERTSSRVREQVRDQFSTPASDHPEARRRIEWLLREVLGYGARLVVDTAVPDGLGAVGQRGVELRADAALVEPREGRAPSVRLALMFVVPGTGLNSPTDDARWSASPVERLTHLLRTANVPLGFVSDGRWLALVWAPRNGPSGHGTWDTDLLDEERVLLDGLITTTHARRFFASGAGSRALETMMVDSASRQSEVTQELGRQVRQAVELLVGTLSRADHHQGGDLLPEDGHEVYEAAVTVMMRLVFCLYAEERRLLPAGDPTYDAAYAIGGLLDMLDGTARAFGPELLEHRTTGWHHLLASFRAIHGGVAHEDLLIPAYGGGLFDPDRYPFLEGRAEGTEWHETRSRPLPVDDRTVLEVLRALQELEIGGETRRLSFRTLDVEQIGHVYEGLLDHSAIRADSVHLGLGGKLEPEIALEEIEAEHTSDTAITSYLSDATGLSERQVTKALTAQIDANADRLLLLACENNAGLSDRVRPYVGVTRRDLRDIPVVIPDDAMMVTQTSIRRDSGTQYTTRDLADEIAIHALEPLVFTGPVDGVPRAQWHLKTSEELLALKVCDPAVGSGAIIVAALRYLSERLLEAWEVEGVHGGLAQDDRLVVARRDVAEHCLYGVDRDPLALEMAKLSLWLSTMSRDRPFTFLDHSFKSGDSLLGITTIEQLRHLHLDPARGRQIMGSRAWARSAAEIVQPKIDRALELVQRLRASPTTDLRAASLKQSLENAVEDELSDLQILGDMVVAPAMVASYRRPRDYDAALMELTHAVTHAPEGGETAAISAAAEVTAAKLQSDLPDDAPSRVPLHWPLAFPEVFLAESRSGFDALIGNPPFRGGQYLTDTLGTNFREYLVGQVANGVVGSADLVAYFVLRAEQLVRLGGELGFIATNSIAQQQTRRVGLDALVARSCTIRRGVAMRPWPGKAGVSISQVWLHKGSWRGHFLLDGARVTSITPGLTDGQRPMSLYAVALKANKNLMFMGATPGRREFYDIPTEQVNALTTSDQSASEIVRRFLTGGDICDSPGEAPSRWCVDTFLFEAVGTDRYERVMNWLHAELGYPQNENWWRWERPRPKMRAALYGLERYIGVPTTAKRLLTSWQDASTLANNLVNVLASDDDYVMGVMTSHIHEIWARSRPSSLETRLRYTPSDMFETFPLPPQPTVETRRTVAERSRTLHDRRRRMCLDANVGLTELYNRMDSGDLPDLLSLHLALDAAVCAAYRWPQDALESDDAVLGRLVALSTAISNGTQPYDPGIRPTGTDVAEARVGRKLRMRL